MVTEVAGHQRPRARIPMAPPISHKVWTSDITSPGLNFPMHNHISDSSLTGRTQGPNREHSGHSVRDLWEPEGGHFPGCGGGGQVIWKVFPRSQCWNRTLMNEIIHWEYDTGLDGPNEAWFVAVCGQWWFLSLCC